MCQNSCFVSNCKTCTQGNIKECTECNPFFGGDQISATETAKFARCISCPPTCKTCKIAFDTKKITCDTCVDATLKPAEGCVKVSNTLAAECDTSKFLNYVKLTGSTLSCEKCTDIPDSKCAECQGPRCTKCADGSNLYPPCMLFNKQAAPSGQFYIQGDSKFENCKDYKPGCKECNGYRTVSGDVKTICVKCDDDSTPGADGLCK